MQSTAIDAGREYGTVSAARATDVYSKVTWRLVPLLFVCYVLSYLDRINVGFAQLQMKSDLGFSDAVYGLGAGIFFIGYFLFEVPSNMLLERIGAQDDHPDYGHLGLGLGRHGFRQCAVAVLHSPLFPGRVRSGLLPGHHPLLHLLVP